MLKLVSLCVHVVHISTVCNNYIVWQYMRSAADGDGIMGTASEGMVRGQISD